LWSTGETTPALAGLTAGVYTVTVTDANGCTAASDAFLFQPSPMLVNISTTSVTCHGASDGAVLASMTGGVAPYQYTWQSDTVISSDALWQNIPAGVYALSVSDSNGCVVAESITVEQPALPLVVNIPVPPQICPGASTGSLSVAAQGGTLPYAYSWSTTSTFNQVNNLSAGTYTVTATDDQGCTATTQQTVTEQAALSVSLIQTEVTCFGTATGSAQVAGAAYGQVSTSLSALTFVWVNNQVGAGVSGLLGNSTYTVTATDAQGCTGSASIFVAQPQPLTAQVVTYQNPQCAGATNGSMTVSTQGGNGGYTYMWWPVSSTTPQNTNIASGTYQVTITDILGCSTELAQTLTDPPAIFAVAVGNTLLCADDTTGMITATATELVGAATYNWGISTNNPLTGVSSGVYTVTVTDSNGCTATAEGTVSAPPVLVAELWYEDPSCHNRSDGELGLVVQGGSKPYQSQLNNGMWLNKLNYLGLAAGTYTILLRDSNGCRVDVQPVALMNPQLLVVDLGADLTLEYGTPTILTAGLIGAQGAPMFTWQSDYPDTSIACISVDCGVISLLPVSMNTYTVEVVDGAGCRAADDMTIRVRYNPVIAVPTAFNPQGDLINQQLHVHGSAGAQIVFFRVFDRWGNLVYERNNFETNDLTIGWDGTWRGEPLEGGTYVWSLEAGFINGHRQFFEGATVLLR